jgi:cation transport protein ChaC
MSAERAENTTGRHPCLKSSLYRSLMPEKPILTREALLNGEIERLVLNGRSSQRTMSDDQRTELVQITLDNLGEGSELWIFGYGSLIWNPAIDFEEQRRCTIQGYQKKFCFWTTLSRGSEEQPGLMMGLVEGNQCNGVAYRIDLKKAASELDILFRREMTSYIYKPTWVEARCEQTNTSFNTLTFVVDSTSNRCIEDLAHADMVSTIATARGPLGRNCDYLFQLSEKLGELGFEEPELEALACQVREYQAKL